MAAEGSTWRLESWEQGVKAGSRQMQMLKISMRASGWWSRGEREIIVEAN